MAPKSSDSEVTDGTGSSSDLDHMETSLGVALSLMGKRRAETDDSGESAQTADEDRLDEDSEGEENELDEDNDELDEENELDEDSDELDEEEEGDEGESYRRNEENREPEWGYDSFDGREYDSPNLGDYSDKEFEEQCRHYKRQLIETKGFFETSDKFPPYVYTPGIASLGDLDEPAMLGLTIREVCEKLTSLCLQRYNEDEASLN
ncbi:PREDICTED: uncharacterized protein LOC104712103 [Camelina sativa]|uniref:Uncharacterized protein LOC104712103 n=1 Tax=Camelina sativa TaxID=90675 RepID=A0ABM1R2F3_CAMSA|nr:PREDICTED: uncharacterized protein LOC104712103 [Camelina sativa]